MSSTVAPEVMLAGRYRLVRRLASGGMGQVWRANDEILGRPVAVKLLRSEYAEDPEFVDRFRAEARRTAALSHPGIASVFDYGETGDTDAEGTTAYLVMELVEGEPLSVLLAREGRLSAAHTLNVLAQSALALDSAHQAGVVHRDVKPSNLLLRRDGVVKVTDFGIAHAADEAPRTEAGMVVGTAAYLSPEQVACRPATPASDVYALGVVAYECLAGRRPFTGEHPIALALAHRRSAPPPLPEDVPDAVQELVAWTMSKVPRARPPSAGALGRQALVTRAGLPEGSRPDDPETPTGGWLPVMSGWHPALGRGREPGDDGPPPVARKAPANGDAKPNANGKPPAPADQAPNGQAADGQPLEDQAGGQATGEGGQGHGGDEAARGGGGAVGRWPADHRGGPGAGPRGLRGPGALRTRSQRARRPGGLPGARRRHAAGPREAGHHGGVQRPSPGGARSLALPRQAARHRARRHDPARAARQRDRPSLADGRGYGHRHQPVRQPASGRQRDGDGRDQRTPTRILSRHWQRELMAGRRANAGGENGDDIGGRSPSKPPRGESMGVLAMAAGYGVARSARRFSPATGRGHSESSEAASWEGGICSSLASASIASAGKRRWPPSVRMYGSFPSFAQRDTVLGVTCRIAATSVAVMYPDRLAGPMRLHPFYMLAGHAAPEGGLLRRLRVVHVA